ncbi:putative mitochondrial carrier protein [Podospora australis]|uniref:Mitochondrial carrier protein n=1 Tax=Podospora australis TaxID=1536484 RepID=A0AAN7AN75_9PEZI|nr:putative mitochondrial carrier protein [Podospora australis]
MPLVDPVTMSSAISKKGNAAGSASKSPVSPSTATATAPATYSLAPVQTKQTPLAQSIRYAHPLLLGGILAARFPALISAVATPVSAMATSILPLTAALQIVYAVICLPGPGGNSGSSSKKSKPRPGEKKKNESGGNNAVITALLSMLLTAFIVPFIYITMVLFGAPLLTHGWHTVLAAAHIAVLGMFPLFYVHGVDASAWAAVGGFKAPLDETFAGWAGSLLGAWLGAVPIPLDWDREWQKWPVPILVGAFGAKPPPPPASELALPETKSHKHYKGFAAGVFSGIAKLAVGHPFDTIKVRLQTSPPSRFSGPLQCLTQTIRNEGLFALYKGATPPLVGWMFMDSVMLGSLTFYRRLVSDNLFHSQPLPAYGHGIAGVMAGATVSFVAAPVEHVKARLQIQYSADKSKRLYSGPIDVLKKVYKFHGIKGIYHGLQATLLFRSWFFCWWGSYDLFSRWMKANTNWSAPLINFWAGGLSAQVFWVVSYPSDVVKQRIMTDPLGGGLNDGTPRFPRWRDAAKAVYREGGYMGYWRGFVPCFLRAFPANAMALVAFEAAMRALPE